MANFARAISLGALLSLLAEADVAAQSIPIYTYVQPSERTITRRDDVGGFVNPSAVVPLSGGGRSVLLPNTDAATRSITSGQQRASRSAPLSEYAAERRRADALLTRLRGLLEPPANVSELPPPVQAVVPPDEQTTDRPSIDYGGDPWDEVNRNPAP
jgi:hypothetical protein